LGAGAELGVLGVGYRTLQIKKCVFRYVRHPTALALIKQTMMIHAECVEEWANAYMTVPNLRGRRTFSWGWTYKYLTLR
jgi:hypothetical protein